MAGDDVIASVPDGRRRRVLSRARTDSGQRRSCAEREAGFTIVELVVSMALLAIVAAPLAGVFWSAIRTAGVAGHRTDGSSIASREIEGMRAIPYAQVGFYNDQNPASYLSFTTVSLGATSPSSGALIPQIQPVTPDPNAAVGYAPDPYPANKTKIIQGGVGFSVARYVVWVNAQDSASTFTQAYKRLIVVVSWTDQAGTHQALQDSVLYPGGLGAYGGPMGGSSTTTSTTIASTPDTPTIAAAAVQPTPPADETSASLTWAPAATGAAPTSWTLEYSTSPSFSGPTIVNFGSASITSYTVPSLAPNTKYYFEVFANANGFSSSASSWVSITTAALILPTCNLGGLNVAGATSLSTTGTRQKSNGQMSEDLTLSWSTTGSCTDAYQVKAVDPTNAADPGSPYSLSGSGGAYSGTVNSKNQSGWAIGLHTFTVWDLTTNSATSVVKTFKVCVNGAATC